MKDESRVPPLEGNSLRTVEALGSLMRVLPNRSFTCPTCENEPEIEHLHYLADEMNIVDPYDKPGTVVPRLAYAKCSVCGRQDKRLYSCSLCLNVTYCGKSCQINNWARHSKHCNKMENGKAINSSSDDSYSNHKILHDVEDLSKPSEKISNGQLTNIPNLIPRIVQMKSQAENLQAGDTIDHSNKKETNIISTVPHVKVTIDNGKQHQLSQQNTDFNKTPISNMEHDNLTCKIDLKLNNEKVKCQKEVYDELNGVSAEMEQNCSVKPSPEILCKKDVLDPLKTSKSVENELSASPFVVGATYDVIFSCFEEPNRFFVQKKENTALVEEITSKLTSSCAHLEKWSRAKDLSDGEIVAVVYEQDGNWYRARIISRVPNKTRYEVHFIDYGNSSSKVSYKHIQELPDEFKNIQPLASKCTLRDIKPFIGETWETEVLEKVDALIERTGFSRCKIYSLVGDLYHVDLYDSTEKISMRDELIEEKIAQSVSLKSDLTAHNGQDSCQKIASTNETGVPDSPENRDSSILGSFRQHLKFERIKTDSGLVLNREKGGEPIIYVLADVNRLKSLFDIAGNFTDVPKIRTYYPGTFTLFYSQDEEEYNRAIIVKEIHENVSQVYLLDYGTIIEVDNETLHVIPDSMSIKAVPALAVRCLVENASEIESFEKIMDKKIVKNGAVKFEVVSPIEDGFYRIKILKKSS